MLRLVDRMANKIEGSRLLVTGGAGFIGSNMSEALIGRGASVAVYDNLSSGSYSFIEALAEKGLRFTKGDILNKELFTATVKRDSPETIVHFAANPNVKFGNGKGPIDEGILTTYNVLEACREGDVKNILFSSSGSVYGIAKVKPTPEEYGPLKPISIYGATKLSSEGLISAFSNMYGINFCIFRFANVVGKNATHGIVFDLINKLRKNSSELNVLGDGSQRKSYISADDCVSAVLYVYEKTRERENIFNVASDDQISVREIADIVIAKAAKGARKVFGITHGGWPGDITDNFISNRKLKEFGFSPKLNSRAAIEAAADYILAGKAKAV